MESAILFKVDPAPHGDLAGVKFAIPAMPGLVSTFRLSSSLPRVTPREIVKVPERVHRQHEVPNGKREQVNEQPHDIAQAMGSYDDEHSGQPQDQSQEDERHCRSNGVRDSRNDGASNYIFNCQ